MWTWEKSKDLLDPNIYCDTTHAEKVFNLKAQQLSGIKKELKPRTYELKSIWSIGLNKPKSHRSKFISIELQDTGNPEGRQGSTN